MASEFFQESREILRTKNHQKALLGMKLLSGVPDEIFGENRLPNQPFLNGTISEQVW